MKKRARGALAAVLSMWLSGPAGASQAAVNPPGAGEAAILQLQVIQGEGAVHTAGTRSSRPLVVEVTDEAGRPVEGAAVSFRMPEEEPSGTFASGLRTEVLVTGRDGRASVWGIQWGMTPGPVRIRITAARGHARAGTVAVQQIEARRPGNEPSTRPVSASRPRGRWLPIAVAAAGAAAGGLVLGLTRQTQQASAAAASAAALSAAKAPAVQVGPPTITIGKP